MVTGVLRKHRVLNEYTILSPPPLIDSGIILDKDVRRLDNFACDSKLGFLTTASYGFLGMERPSRNWNWKKYRRNKHKRYPICEVTEVTKDHASGVDYNVERVIIEQLNANFRKNGKQCPIVASLDFTDLEDGKLAEKYAGKDPYHHKKSKKKQSGEGTSGSYEVQQTEGHAVLIVGYNNKPKNCMKRYVTIKNSHGKTWGKKGYTNIGLDTIDSLIIPDYNPERWNKLKMESAKKPSSDVGAGSSSAGKQAPGTPTRSKHLENETTLQSRTCIASNVVSNYKAEQYHLELSLSKSVAFAMDPLHHQTTAQFDESGSKGLLHGGCRMVFDSSEVPGKCMTCSSDRDKIDTIENSYATDCIEQMVSNFSKKLEITPTLKQIVNMFDEDNRRPTDTFSSSQKPVEPDHEANDDEYNEDGHDNSEMWDFINDDGTYEGEEERFVPVHCEDNGAYVSHDGEVEDIYLTADSFLFPSLGLTGKQNAWAGPDHWKCRKTKGPEDPEKENGSPLRPKKQRNKKQAEPDIEFMKALDLTSDVGNIFAPPKNPNTLSLPANGESCNATLPEDYGECLGKRGRRSSDEPGQEADGNNETYASWDDECGQFDDGNAYSDVEDSTTIVSQPRLVNRIEGEYDKTSKQVDVQALKETLWSSMQETHDNGAYVSYDGDSLTPSQSSKKGILATNT